MGKGLFFKKFTKEIAWLCRGCSWLRGREGCWFHIESGKGKRRFHSIGRHSEWAESGGAVGCAG